MWEYNAAVPYPIPLKMGWCAVDPQPCSDPLAPVWQALVNGLVMAGVLLLLFIVQEKLRSKRRRAEHARSIFQELDRMRERLWPEFGTPIRLQPDNGAVRGLSRSTYDGLVSSAAISTLSDNLQRQLGDFYNSLREESADTVKGSILNLMDDVKNERKNAEAWWRLWERHA